MTTALMSPAAQSPPADEAAASRAATRVLLGNWRGTTTVPSGSLYPHQWSWDSAFIALGLRHLSPRRAQSELEHLLGAQWDDGRVPHIVFHPSVPLTAYFPSPDFWRSSTVGRHRGAPAGVETSGIVQPPVHALAAWLVHLAAPKESRRRGFLPRLYPRLVAWHRYLADCRDLGGAGLAAITHPWEAGLDNSPVWDGPLGRVSPVEPGSYRRADLDHSAAADRPTDLDYGRYVRLAADYRDSGYEDARAGQAFAVEDPCFNTLLVLSEQALARIAAETGRDAAPHRERAARLERTLLARLWDPEQQLFAARDLLAPGGGALLPGRSVAGLVPLALPGLPRALASHLLDTLTGPHFRLGEVALVPSYDLRGEAFDTSRYWRGPSWFNTAWLVHRGLLTQGAHQQAAALREQFWRSAAASGFAEYLDPLTGAGRGARDFSWTAALALDLLRSEGNLT
ncbi:hypothetical protein ACFV3R_28375 [Streptomyces sp. NPDC059740]|uniref:MGH1-like glycoside hydrolase domain-containing protein n=1 Tax=Streptomyces sp. NPDC059740 TaxID=3346926 RepID=UPI003669DC4B